MKGENGRERVMRSVEINEAGCWLWTGCRSNGYGQLHWKAKNLPAHRLSYEAFVGPIPAGLQIDHLCRVHACVNPAHLEPVTQRENSRRGVAGDVNGGRQRAKTHCPQGHPYEGENLFVRKNGKRDCRECSNTNRRKHYALRRA